MFVIKDRSGTAVLPENLNDLSEEFVARIFGLAPIVFWIITVLTDNKHGIYCQLFSATTQSLGNGWVDGETKFFGALTAQIIFRKLIHIGRNQIERRPMP